MWLGELKILRGVRDGGTPTSARESDIACGLWVRPLGQVEIRNLEEVVTDIIIKTETLLRELRNTVASIDLEYRKSDPASLTQLSSSWRLERSSLSLVIYFSFFFVFFLPTFYVWWFIMSMLLESGFFLLFRTLASHTEIYRLEWHPGWLGSCDNLLTNWKTWPIRRLKSQFWVIGQLLDLLVNNAISSFSGQFGVQTSIRALLLPSAKNWLANIRKERAACRLVSPSGSRTVCACGMIRHLR